jgi:hypothetical protein
MLKRMKKIYDVEFHEVSSDWDSCEEGGHYIINKNENKISLVGEKFLSNIATNLSVLELVHKFSVFWDDDNLGTVFIRGKRAAQRRNIVGTVSKVSRKGYFLLLRRMNCYA